jgi:hypothetical protein
VTQNLYIFFIRFFVYIQSCHPGREWSAHL